MPKLKEVSELIESDPILGEQITVFENDKIVVEEKKKANE